MLVINETYHTDINAALQCVPSQMGISPADWSLLMRIFLLQRVIACLVLIVGPSIVVVQVEVGEHGPGTVCENLCHLSVGRLRPMLLVMLLVDSGQWNVLDR